MPPTELAKLTVLYTIPGVESVSVRRDEPYRQTETDPLTMDVYYPPAATTATRLPAVLIVLGYPETGLPNVFGCTFKEMGQPTSWAKLIAASGMVAILYSNREPVEDVEAVLRHVRNNAAALGHDEHRIGLWAGSANVALAVWLLMQADREYLRCAVLCYGYMLDAGSSSGVAEAQKTYRFANPGAGKSIDDVRSDVPLFIARSGREQFPGLNDTIDSFVAGALRRSLPITLVNHADAAHGFDLFHDSEVTREIIRQILGFLRFHLSVESGFSRTSP
jgi:hypothetical protein